MKIGLSNCRDLLNKLQYEKSRLDNEWNEYDFFNFVVTAWHLHTDWIEKNREGRPVKAMKKFKASPNTMKEVINISRDIANGSKHFNLNLKSEKNKVVTQVNEPEIRDWHSYYFGPKYGISTDLAYYSVADFIFIIGSYFEWIFDDEIEINMFPPKLIKHLNYCKIDKNV